MKASCNLKLPWAQIWPLWRAMRSSFQRGMQLHYCSTKEKLLLKMLICRQLFVEVTNRGRICRITWSIQVCEATRLEHFRRKEVPLTAIETRRYGTALTQGRDLWWPSVGLICRPSIETRSTSSITQWVTWHQVAYTKIREELKRWRSCQTMMELCVRSNDWYRSNAKNSDRRRVTILWRQVRAQRILGHREISTHFWTRSLESGAPCKT